MSDLKVSQPVECRAAARGRARENCSVAFCLGPQRKEQAVAVWAPAQPGGLVCLADTESTHEFSASAFPRPFRPLFPESLPTFEVCPCVFNDGGRYVSRSNDAGPGSSTYSLSFMSEQIIHCFPVQSTAAAFRSEPPIDCPHSLCRSCRQLPVVVEAESAVPAKRRLFSPPALFIFRFAFVYRSGRTIIIFHRKLSLLRKHGIFRSSACAS